MENLYILTIKVIYLRLLVLETFEACVHMVGFSFCLTDFAFMGVSTGEHPLLRSD